ncbi:MAG: GumC family protein [Candidatus Tectimicrobiota bacterium]
MMIQQGAAETAGYEDELSLRDYWRILVHYRRSILTLTSAVIVLIALWTLSQPNTYRGTTTLMPLSGPRSSLSSALGELGGLVPGLGGAFSKDNPTDRLQVVLQSYTLALSVVRHLNLLPVLFASKWDAQTQQWRTNQPPTEQDAVRKLNTLVSISASKQGVLTVAVEHPDPVLAAAIANRYISSLQQSLQNNAFSLAKKHRLFIAEQLDKARHDLAGAEEALKQFEQTYGIVALDAQTTAAVQAISFLEGQIMVKEVQLRVQQRLTTGASQEVTLLQEELRGLRNQLSRLQRGLPAEQQPLATVKPPAEQAWVPFTEAPDIKLRYARLQRENLVQNKVYTLLAQQLEQAKIDEARDEIAFQVLDQALPPDRKSKPKRLQNIAAAGFVGLMLSVVLAFVRHALDTTIHTPVQVEQLLGVPVFATLPAAGLLVPSQASVPPPTAAAGVGGRLPEVAMMSTVQYIYTRLRCLEPERSAQTVVLTGPEAAEATEALLMHLALAAARAGAKVLLLDAHFQQPTLHQRYHGVLVPGLAEALAEPAQWQQSIQKTQVEHLHFVAAGTLTPTTLARLAAPEMDCLLAHYQAAYDLILCHAPTSAELHETLLLAQKAGSTCFVVLAGVSTRPTLLTTKHALEAIHAHIAGAVFLDSAS